jgi:membrane protease YdiL (CAAX protease family)
LLHLLPGGLITIAFVLLGPLLKSHHLPPILALLIPILLILVPFELGWLFFQGYRQNGRLSLQGVVPSFDPLPLKSYLILIPILLAWPILIFMSFGKIDQAIIANVFFWLPDWFQISLFSPADYSLGIRIVTFALFLVLNGLAGPIVEELYFRGYLLPRIEFLKGWAPLVNVTLFSLYHFFSPWQFITRIIAFYPWPFVVRKKNNIFLSMAAHCMLNIGYCFMSIHSFF